MEKAIATDHKLEEEREEKKALWLFCNLRQFLAPGTTFYGEILCAHVLGYLCTLNTSEPFVLLRFNNYRAEMHFIQNQVKIINGENNLTVHCEDH